MAFYSTITPVSILPRIFSRLNPASKAIYQTKYKTIKKYGSASVIAGVELAEEVELGKDLICSKLKAYGFTDGSRFRKFAVATTEIGAKISKEEMGIVNWSSIGADIIFLFFGEPVPITDNSDFLILYNETAGKLLETLEELGSGD